MTDLKKFTNLFDKIGIKYRITNDCPYGTDEDYTNVMLYIDSSNVNQFYHNFVALEFTNVGEFITFLGGGD